MNLEEITLGQLRTLEGLLGKSEPKHPYEVGQNYIVRTVTMIFTGKLTLVGDKEIVLEDCAWIAETARWADSLKTGELNEVEPYPTGKVIVGRGAIIDAAIWAHELPRAQK